MSPRHTGFLSILRRWWALVALAAGAGGLIAYVYGSRVEATYEVETLLRVVSATDEPGSVDSAGELAPTYAELVRSERVLTETRKALGLTLTVEELRENVRGEAERGTFLLTIRVRNGDGNQAAQIANVLAKRLAALVASGRPDVKQPGQATPPTSLPPAPRPSLEVIEPAVDVARIRPRVALSMEFGALAGFFGALAVIFLAESLGRTVRSEHDLAELAPLAFLGSVKGGRLSRDGGALSMPAGASPDGTEAYQKLVSRLADANEDEPPRTVLVTGIQGREGSALVAVRLAAALAGPATRVVLADFGGTGELKRLLQRGRRTAEPPLLGRGRPLSRGSTVLDRFPLRFGVPLVLAVPRSRLPRSLALDEARALLELLLEEADAVVLHAAPPGRSPATLGWARLVDATVLVAKRERTRRRSVSAALEGLEIIGANAVGTVLHTARNA
jgi:capsular polysaccharide biosynthesis protein/Mrp family chromosome partitioning ATPase